MLVAFISSITALPALLTLLNPPGESEPVGYAFLAPVDEFLERHRVIIIVGTLLIAVAGLPLLYFMKFDFNPINLRNSKVEVDRDLPRPAQGSQHRRQRHQRADQFGSRRQEDRGEAGEGAGSAARDVARQFRAGRSAGEAEADREGGQGAGAGAQSGFRRRGADRRGERRGAEELGRQPAQDRRRRQGAGRGRRAAPCRCAVRSLPTSDSGDARQGAGRFHRAAEDRRWTSSRTRCRRSRSR